MDERMRALCAAVGFLVSTLSSAQATGQALVDPTRPPADTGRGEPARDEPDSEARVQSILLSPTRKLAVIDGETVLLGGKHRGARLISITPTQVVLRDGETQRVLKLHPGVDKKVHASRAAAGRSGERTP